MLCESVLLLCLCLGTLAAEEPYLVNQLMDDSLVTLSERVKASGDLTARVGVLKAGGWSVTNARLADVSSFARLGDSWMWSEGQTVFINGSLALGAMFLVGDAALGPEHQIIREPLLTVRENRLDFLLSVELDTKSACHMRYTLWWPLIKEVTLYPGDDKGKLDISRLVELNMPAIEDQLSPAISALLQDHGDMCESKRLNTIEMIKYNIDHEALHFLEQGDLKSYSSILQSI